MADKKITELTALTAVVDADVLVIVDDAGGTPVTKKITRADFIGSAAILPDADNGIPLGSIAKQFSDLFLATGGVINWNNTDKLTHSANTMTLAGFTTWDMGAVATLDFNGALSLTTAVGGVAFDGALSGITTLSMNNQLTNSLAIGTSPFVITSTTVNTNLNADLLDGEHASAFQDVAAGLTSIAGLTETNGGMLYGTADNTYAWLAAGAEGTLLMGNGAAAPSFLGAGTSGYMLVAAGAADPVWTLNTGTGAPVRANAPTFTGDVNMSGKYLLNDQTTTNMQAGEAVFYLNGTTQYIEHGDDPNLDVGTGNFSLFIRFKPSSVATAEQYLINKEAVGVGYGLEMKTDDLWIRFDDGTTDVSAIIGTAVFTADNWYEVLVTFDRDGNALAYVNGIATGTTVALSTAALTLSSAGVLRAGTESGGTTLEFTGEIDSYGLYNRLVSATEELDLSAPTAFADVGANQTAIYTSDFSVNVDGWTNGARTVNAGNIDAIGGQDNNLRFYATADNGNHHIARTLVFTAYKWMRISFDYYLPSAQTSVDGWALDEGTGVDLLTGSTTDSWTSVSLEWENVNSTTPRIFLTDGGVKTFIGANVNTDDLMYIRNFVSTQIGEVFAIDANNSSTTTAYDRAGTNNGTITGATLLHPMTHAYVSGDVEVGDDILLADGAVIGIPGNEVITFNAAGSINITGATFDVDGAITGATIASDGSFSMNGVALQAQQATIIDADGTLADITTKFNTLLADLEGFGFLATV